MNEILLHFIMFAYVGLPLSFIARYLRRIASHLEKKGGAE